MNLFLRCLLAAFVIGGALAAPAGATPAWLLGGSQFSGPEPAEGEAINADLTFAGMTTTCATTEITMSIGDSGGTGEGKVSGMNFAGCSTNTICSVEGMTAANLPWPAHLKTVSSNNYLIIEKVYFEIVYGNPFCALNETTVEVKGSAGGSISSSANTSFEPSSFVATNTKLKAFGVNVEWEAEFPLTSSSGVLTIS